MFETVLVDTIDALHNCLSDIASQPSPVHIACDIEGINLCRDGRVCIIQLLAKYSDIVWLIDVSTLGNAAFDNVNDQGRSLRGILQDPAVTKYLYDVRNDSDALYSLHHVRLVNVYDLQLLELATRASTSQNSRLLHSLKRSIDTYLNPPREWDQVKDAGCALFSPARGGRYEVFEERPLDPRLVAYCSQDVRLLFQLEAALKKKMRNRALGKWEKEIVAESAKRVIESCSPAYRPHGQHKALASLGWSRSSF